MPKIAVETLVGSVVLAGVAAVAWIAGDATRTHLQAAPRAYSIEAHFDDLGGLHRNASVRSAGVPIGHVAEVSLDGGARRGRVVMIIDDAAVFPTRSVARILNAGLLGDQYVSIDAGPDDQRLADGDHIEQTQSALIFEDLVERLVHDRPTGAGHGASHLAHQLASTAPPAPAAAAPAKS